MSRNFRASVKERMAGQPCFLELELHEDIGIGDKLVCLDMPEGSSLSDAKRVAKILNENVRRLRTVDV